MTEQEPKRPTGPATNDESPVRRRVHEEEVGNAETREIEPDGMIRPLGTDDDADEDVRRPRHPKEE